jgi:hypothetical protein
VTSAVIYDATFSGYNSIVLGTFGKAILFFCPVINNNNNIDKYFEEQQEIINNSTTREAKTPKQIRVHYEIQRKIHFKHSILGLAQTMLTNSGAYDLVILTLNGFSIWSYEPGMLVDVLNKKFEENEEKLMKRFQKTIT